MIRDILLCFRAKKYNEPGKKTGHSDRRADSQARNCSGQSFSLASTARRRLAVSGETGADSSVRSPRVAALPAGAVDGFIVIMSRQALRAVSGFSELASRTSFAAAERVLRAIGKALR